MWNYYKHVISKAVGYTFQRMTLYLTLFNFTMLGFWVYDNTGLGEWMKGENLKIGDLLLAVIFVLFALSALEYIVIGRNNEDGD